MRQATWTSAGSLKQVLVSDPITGMDAITSMQYDSYGNIDRYALPPNAAGERVNYRIWYDAASMSRPVYIRNQFGEGQQYQYEPYWGKVIMSIDPAGEKIHYMYDRMGRLTTVVAPREYLAASGWWLPAGSNVPYTIRYTYNNIRHNLADPHDTITHTYVLKEMASAPDLDVIRESAIYSARGELVQHKKLTEVNGFTEIVTDGVHVQDALGRVIATLYPSVSNSPLWVYDGTSNSTGANPTKVWYDVLDRDTLINLPDAMLIHKRNHFDIDLYGTLRLASWQTDQLGNVTRQLTSPQGWTIQTTQADNTHTMFDYNCIGELQRVIDADGYRTYYEYDLFGRRIRREHPDANITYWWYDPAGNIVSSATQRQKDVSQTTDYRYCFNRLMSTIPNGHPWDSVLYNYDTAGRLAWREDKTGEERMWYDELGNVRQTLRRIYTPAEECAYQFVTAYNYDSFGRIRTLFYPDGEKVNYTYNIGGYLIDVNGNEHYLQKIMYNVLGNMTYKMYGNGYLTAHSYDTQRQWLQTTYTNGVYNLQDIEYQHDYVGNITKIKQNAIAAAGMGGDYTQDYAYNNRYRLVRNDFTSTPFGNYRYDVSYSSTGRMGSKSCNNFPGAGPFSLNYGYDDHTFTHQSRVIYDYDSGERLQLYWDRDGNLEQIQPKNTPPRFHLWDDEDRLLASIGGTTCGFYGNAADGRRAYKLTGGCSYQQWNNGTIIAYLTFDDVVLYPNPYITVTPHGYTKHYFAGTERIATAIGGGGFCNMITPTDNLTNTEQVRKHEILKYLSSYLSDQTEDHTNNEDIAHHLLPELQYSDARQTLHNISYNIYLRTSLCTTLNELCNKQKDDVVFYYHPDHLGGAAWITDMSGKPVQYLHYAPYGELVANQMPYGIDERFKFTGKERDAETGYDNFEARPYLSAFSIFGKVDPLTDKYIGTQPYLYCNGNPMMYIDSNGEEATISFVVSNINNSEELKRNKLIKERASISSINSINNDYTLIWAHGAEDGTYIEYAAKFAKTFGNIEYSPSHVNSGGLYGILEKYNESFKNDPQNAVVIFISCNTGLNESSIAYEFSKTTPQSVIIAPTDKVAVDNKGRVRVKNNGYWNVIVDGKTVDTIKGNKGALEKYLQDNSNKEALLQKYDNSSNVE